MSSGGLKSISESPNDSLRDSDQYSLKGDVLLEESEDEGGMPIESIGGFFIKHGTFIGTETDPVISHGVYVSDSDYDTDLETEEKAEKYDATGRKVYIAACECLNITPVSFFLRNIQEKKLDFRHRLLGPKGGRAIAAALEQNTTLTSLNLHDNYLEGDGGAAIAAMLKENCYITELDVSSNHLGALGCQWMCDMLQNNVSLLKIDLSDNGFNDKDTVFLLDALKGNDKLTWMNLSRNKFSEKSGDNLGLGISSNDALEHLDLSWNHIRRQGAIGIANGLRTNCTLKTFNLSYNGFSNDGAVALGEAVRANNTLLELDISNRITMQGAMCIAKGLEGNNTLEILKVESNPIGTEGARAILSAAKNFADSALTELHFKDIYLDESFDQLLREVRQVKPDIQIRANLRPGVKDPLSVVKSFVSNNQDQWMEFCQEYNYCKGAMKISRTDFVKCLKRADITFEIEQTARLLARLDPKKEGSINYKSKMLGYQELHSEEPET